MDDAVLIEVEKLCRLMHERGLKELAVSRPGFTLELAAVEAGVAVHASPVACAQLEEPTREMQGTAIITPLTGMFYRSASPESPPFVEVGDFVESGQVIGIVEAMKVFNEITADRAGTVIAVPAENGHLVQVGQALVVVE